MAVGVAALATFAIVILCSSVVDQELTPQARALFTAPSPAVVKPGSGYALIAGFDSPEGSDPRTTGATWAENVRKAAVEGGRYPVPRGRLAIKASVDMICIPEATDCLAHSRGNPIWFEELARDNAALLARYDELQRDEDLTDGNMVFSYNAPLPPYSVVMQAQNVFLTLAAYRANRGKLDETLAMLEMDRAFQRRRLSQSATIISKMVGARALLRDLLVTSQLLRSRAAFTPSQLEAIGRIASPLDRQEIALSGPIRKELSEFAAMMERLKNGKVITTADLAQWESKALNTDAAYLGSSLYVVRFFAAPNATLNFMEPVQGSWLALDAVESRDLDQAIARIRQENAERLRPTVAWAYNPLGRWLATQLVDDLSQYVMRVRDVDAFARLVCVQTQVKASAIGPAAIEAFLALSDPRCHDPYTDKPFRWDAAAGQIWFKPGSARIAADNIGGRKDRVGIALAPQAQ